MDNPLVTVNILSYNRKDELRITLTKVFEQDYKNIEVIVVDNASTDGTPEMVKKEFPKVKLIELKKNIGIAGWNKGFGAAKGEYVLVLDDDSYPERNVVRLIANEFMNCVECGAIALKVLNIYEDGTIRPFPGGWVPTVNYNIDNWALVLGCGFALRKNLFIENLFIGKYFINFHELPIVLQIFNRGYKIKYRRDVLIYHMNQKFNKSNPIKDCYHFRNAINFVFYHFNKPKNIFMLIKLTTFFFTTALRRKWFFCYMQSLSELRKPFVTFTTYRFSKEETDRILNSGILNYRFLSKFKR